jgi:signal peptidase I
VRSLVIETYYVPSESMLPTLLIGDHMLVNKFAFGARIPFTDTQLPALREPRRGDVVTFVLGRRGPTQICPVDRCPDYPREGFVKRIVGLPGDTIEVRDGGLVLNGESLHVDYSGETFTDTADDELRLGIELLDGAPHPVLDTPRRNGLDQIRITVPEGRYFMMGDNRDNSNDSRGWGTVRRIDIKGPVTMIYWSWNNRGSWWSMLNPLTWWKLLTGETRWSRIGISVE